MKITHIKVSASRTFNHPTERFANFRHEFELTAELDAADQTPEGVGLASLNLRCAAEEIAESYKRDILADLARERLREEIESHLSSARRWGERVDNYRSSLAKLNGFADKLHAWESIEPHDRIRLSKEIVQDYYAWNGSREDLVKTLNDRIGAVERNIAEETENGPPLIASLESRLRALPSLRLLPEATDPEIHPWHQEHPDTDHGKRGDDD